MDRGTFDRFDASAVRGVLELEDRARQAKYLDFIEIYARLTTMNSIATGGGTPRRPTS